MAKPDPSREVSIKISEFKTHCLRLLEKTGRQGTEYIVTKNGAPLARVIPIKGRGKKRRLGILKGMIKAHSDIVHFDSSAFWEVLQK
jgi:prevent-host-death family protein